MQSGYVLVHSCFAERETEIMGAELMLSEGGQSDHGWGVINIELVWQLIVGGVQ